MSCSQFGRHFAHQGSAVRRVIFGIGCCFAAAAMAQAASLYPTSSTAKDWNYGRVVVGTNSKDQPVFARKEAIDLEESTPTGLRMIWAEDSLPVALPTDGLTPGLKEKSTAKTAVEDLARASVLPVPGTSGVRVFWYEFGPEYKATNTTPLHWHDSTEIWSIAQGEVVLVLEGGAEHTLRRGDAVVVTGVNHRWENRSGKSCIASVVSLASVRKGKSPPAADDLTKIMSSPMPRPNPTSAQPR
jgi:quercetin dioxygenase-like cupin family protein